MEGGKRTLKFNWTGINMVDQKTFCKLHYWLNKKKIEWN